MHYASICLGGAAEDSEKNHPADHSSASDLAGVRWRFRQELPCCYPSIGPTEFHLPRGDIVGQGVHKVANAMG